MDLRALDLQLGRIYCIMIPAREDARMAENNKLGENPEDGYDV
jgi:hypothetical protein